jgi:hypothetical protein
MNLALKAKYSFYSALVFFLVANPETYKVLQSLLGGTFDILTSGGCVTPVGLFIQTIVFFFVILGLMMFPRD